MYCTIVQPQAVYVNLDYHPMHGVSCDNLTFEVTVSDHVWMRTLMGDNSEEEIITAKCKDRFCREGSKRFNQDNVDSQCSPELRRSGLLCGGCAPNPSALLGSNSCWKCSDYFLLLIPIFGLAGMAFSYLLQ